VTADSVTLNGDWTGTGIRAISPFSPIGIQLAGATGISSFQLSQTALAHLSAGGGSTATSAPVIIGDGLSGPITADSFTFNDH